MDKGFSAPSDGLSQAEPEVSALRASIPSAWASWQNNPPQPGQKVVIVCDDGCSSSLALMTEDGPLDGECGEPFFGDSYLSGAIWTAIPDDYPLSFMEAVDDY